MNAFKLRRFHALVNPAVRPLVLSPDFGTSGLIGAGSAHTGPGFPFPAIESARKTLDPSLPANTLIRC